MKSKFRVGQTIQAKRHTTPRLYKIAYVSKSGAIRVDGNGTWYNPELFQPAYLGTAVIRNTRNGQFRVNLTGKNGEKMYTSEPYTTKAMAMKTARLMKDFEIVDKTKGK